MSIGTDYIILTVLHGSLDVDPDILNSCLIYQAN